MSDIPGSPLRASHAELIVNLDTGKVVKNRYAAEVEVDRGHAFIFPPKSVLPADTSQLRKKPSTIRVLSDVCDSIVALGKVDERIRQWMMVSTENEPTDDETRELVALLGTVIEKLADIQGKLTMGVKE